jgi:type II secretory pathway component PulF
MKVSDQVTVVCCVSLAVVLLSTAATCLYAFFDVRVDNAALFKMMEPAFNMIVGAFVGTIAGIKIGKDDHE